MSTMAPLNQTERDELTAYILQQLSTTPYACSSLVQLTNGTTNFVFRGTLIQQLCPQNETEATETVIIKHATAFAAVNKDFPIDVSRCVAEESMLKALNEFHYDSLPPVKIPHLYLFNREANIQVLEDISGVVDLKTILESGNALSQPLANSIGHALGSWLRTFHAWASSPRQYHLRASAEEVGTNEPMRKLKYQITYDSFIKVLEQFPDVLSDHKESLEEVKALATREFDKTTTGDDDNDDGEGEWGLIHGDFWSGNVLFPEKHAPYEDIKLFIVDWEFAQFGHRAYDIGQMIGDLYERKHFKGIDAAVWAIEGFIEGYGALTSEEMAFRVAIHVGVQMITWVTRGPPLHVRPAWAQERAPGIVELGMTFILKGWEKDTGWLKGSVLEGLFTGNGTGK